MFPCTATGQRPPSMQWRRTVFRLLVVIHHHAAGLTGAPPMGPAQACQH